MLVYRVFPHLPAASAGEPGHASYVHPDQGAGRWDNPNLYEAFYCATSAEAAIGESFAHISAWSVAMLRFPQLPGSVRALGTYRIDEEAHPLLDFDDPRALHDRGLRPTQVVVRNRPATQRIGADVYREGIWSGIRWWSMHRPQWTLLVLFDSGVIEGVSVEGLAGHPALLDAGARLAKVVDEGLATPQ